VKPLTKYDTIVVGGGTAGLFSSYKLSKKGFKVLLIERKKKEDIGHKICGDAIGHHHFEETGLEPPKIGEDALGEFHGVRVYAPDEQHYVTARGLGYALDRYKFGQRLLKMTLNAGTELLDGHIVTNPIFDHSKVLGVEVMNIDTKEKRKIESKVVIDASGAVPAIRTKLPSSWWVSEKTPPEDYDKAYREIIKIKDEIDDEYALIYLNINIAPGGYWWLFPKTKNIINIGLGVQNTQANPHPKDQLYKHVIPRLKDKIEQVITSGGWLCPTRRTIDCMVWNGLIIIGDAACTANPIHGGGIGPSLLSALAAAETIEEALEKGEPTIEKLWNFHHKYHKVYGAKQAGLDILRIYLQKLSNDDLNYVISKQIVTDEELTEMGYKAKLGAGIINKLYRGLKLLTRPTILVQLKTVKEYMDKAISHYMNYPETPRDFEKWRKEAQELFSEFRRKI